MHFNDQELPNVPGTQQRVPGIAIQLGSSYMKLIKDNESGETEFTALLLCAAELRRGGGLEYSKDEEAEESVDTVDNPVLDKASSGVMSTEDTTPLDQTLWTWIKNL
uniref:Uncharacterized protein n=1 Tax=Oryza punctata TaxID=4537 RepID=A0A0E0MK73_ORYPU